MHTRNDSTVTPRRRTLGVLLVLAVSTGVVTSSAVGLAAPAQASPYPSWAQVQAAKTSQTKAEQAEKSLDSAITTLQKRASDAADSASGAGERYQIAVLAQQSAASSLKSLKSQQAAAAKRAEVSQQRVGQLVAELSHSGGGQLTVTMLTESKHASDLLYQLGTMTNLTSRTKGLLEQAKADNNLASSLSDQAQAAQSALQKRTEAASAALKNANELADTAAAALSSQQKSQAQLISQVAYLRGTSVAVEQKYYAGKAVGTVADTTPPPTSGGSSSTGSSATKPNKPAAPAAPAKPAAPSKPSQPSQPSKPTQPTQPSKPAPPAPPAPPSSGSTAAVNTAIAYARAQLGKTYVFGGAGPNVFDCSGLMMAAYSAAGVYIGGHSVRLQYEYLRAQGRTVPISQWRAGDILFYYNGSDGYYHDAMYIGGGQMLEAPNPNAKVRIVAVRYSQLLTVVGRPVG